MKKITPDQRYNLDTVIADQIAQYGLTVKDGKPESTREVAHKILDTIFNKLEVKPQKTKSEKKSSGRFFAPITKEELANKILNAFRDNQHYDEKEYKEWLEDRGCSPKMSNIKIVTENAHCLYPKQLTKQIEKDLSKVEFDTENLTCDYRESFGYGKLVGFNTLPNGLTHLGISCGGDWEQSLYWIIYFDGNQLRAYIPTDGNTWNTDNKMAYGNGEEKRDKDRNIIGSEDNDNAKKRFGVKIYECAEPDPKAIIQDIISRIKLK